MSHATPSFWIPSNSIVLFELLENNLIISANSSSLVHATISKNLGTLYTKANAIGKGNNKHLHVKLFVGWQTLMYRSTAMLIVTATDPTLPMCAKPMLKKTYKGIWKV